VRYVKTLSPARCRFILIAALSDRLLVAVERGTRSDTTATKNTDMDNELAQSPFIQDGVLFLIIGLIVIWFLAKKPLQQLWEWIRQLLAPPD